jgi:cytoskeletal protein RodZ
MATKSEDTCYTAQFDMLSAGQMLKEAREKLKLTRAEIAEHIYLRTQVIIDLENDHYSQLGAEVYIRGYLRNYAKIVNLSPQSVLSAFETIYQPTKKSLPKTRPLHTTTKDNQKKYWRFNKPISRYLVKIIIIAIIALLAIIAVSWYGEKQLVPSGMMEKNATQIIHPIESFNTDSTQTSS